MRALCWVVLWIGGVCGALLPVHASDALYRAIVPVADTGAAARNQAIVQAAGVVLVQLSGNLQVAAQPGVAAALADAPALVKNYRYTRGASGALLLDVDFDPQALESLARRLALPVWPAPRPPVLVMASIGGQPPDAASVAALQAAGAARGIKFVLPQAGAPAASALVAGDNTALDQLARQYHTGLALVGDIADGIGNWTLVTGVTRQSWQAPAATAGAALVVAGNAAADRLVARFAAAPAQAGGTVGRLWVGDLRSARQYAALMLLLRSDPRIRGVRPLQANGDSLLLSLQLDVPLTTVAADLAASGHMVNAGAQPGADVALDWVR